MVSLTKLLIKFGSSLIIFGQRSLHVSDGNKAAGLLHVTMNEGFSQTDYDYQRIGDGHITVLNCFRRGLREELGIGEYDTRINDIFVYDLFITKESFQIGLFAWAVFQGNEGEVRELRAQDKHMESPKLLSINFTNTELQELLKDNSMVPYARVGLENLCRIHGLQTRDFNALDPFYYWCLFKSIFD